MRIGPHQLPGRVLLAPMAGITDRPFRELCHGFGAALTCGEMLASDPQLWNSSKSARRRDHDGAPGLRAVQLAGSDPRTLAEAARRHADLGADIIDLNLGCPARKVCNRLCGSALLSDEGLVASLFTAMVAAVDVPVTAKIRTGPSPGHRNAVRIARLAQECGIAALAVHGRTRADLYNGHAEFATVRAVKATVGIPVIANGDITSPQRAQAVLHETGADAVMIGRGAQGAPWIFRAVNSFLDGGEICVPLLRSERAHFILRHLESLYEFYGECTGVRMARKHLKWYCQSGEVGDDWRRALLAAPDSVSQRRLAARVFEQHEDTTEHEPIAFQGPAAARSH